MRPAPTTELSPTSSNWNPDPLQETSWKVPAEIAKKVAAPRLTPENAAILARIKATSGTAHLRADLQGAPCACECLPLCTLASLERRDLCYFELFELDSLGNESVKILNAGRLEVMRAGAAVLQRRTTTSRHPT